MFKSHYKFLYFTLQTRFTKTPKFTVPISQLHSSISKTLNPNLKLDFVLDEVERVDSSRPRYQISQQSSKSNEFCVQSKQIKGNESTVHVSHPWPEWVDLMELLLKRGYFDAKENPFINGELGTKETNWIRTACLNFARDQCGLIRFFSRRDIHFIAVCGCPSIDRKVVNSGKRLRAHVHIDEGNVCSSCKLRGDCERAYVKAREDEGGRTVDVMRFLLTYGLDSNLVNSDNKLSQNKIVKESVRRLLKEMVEYSSNQDDTDPPKATEGQENIPMKQGDWLCPKCKFLNFARNVRCLRCNGLFQDRLRRLQEDQDHLPLKKGDWICEKCNFLNFAKNTRCLQCEEKPPKRQLSLGEWECESCNYINFRRNMVCLKCDHRRSKALNSPNNVSTKPERDNGGYRRLSSNNAENEAANDISEKRGRKNRKRGPRNWKFVEEEEDEEDSSLCNKDARYMNFPIVGGKSILSQDEEKREKWKVEMLEKKNKSVIRTSESDEEVEYDDDTRGTFKYVEATDAEDMAEWFGHTKKTESNCSVSATHENGVP